ncbi:hypothetical protein OG547_35550 (plasmid) [Streptomyces longwoodensis]|uniref:hypothetical protein n=1 Tax=Streptomyces longwoodensis TaxID=68231 RepID=UPI002ED1045A|nr:hypothetical protein OG547_35550 [Streptomyces longwoodensis]
MHLTPPCPDCSTATERIEVEGEEVCGCTAPDCTRRTYGTGDPDADDALPPYTETDADGAVVVHHGTGEVDIEATAELAAQDGPDEDDPADEEQPAPADGAPHPASPPGVGHVPGAPGWGTSPTGRGRRPGTERAPGTSGTPTAITDSDAGAGAEPQRPQPGVGHGPVPQRLAPSPRGHR